MNIPKRFKLYFKGHERSVRAKKNILGSFAVKGASIIVGFLIVRITLDYLDPTKYGIWLTVTAFLGWFTFFEIGLGNGLKNKLAEALAAKDYKLGKIYVSTTYAILTIIVSFLALIFFIANFFIDWTIILNSEKELYGELTSMTFIIFGFFFFKFVLKLITTVLHADQRIAIANSFGPIANLIAFILIYILTKTTSGSLIYLAWAVSLVPIIVLTGATIYFYSNRYKNIAPSIKYVKFSYAKHLLNLGIKFFFIQIVQLIVYQSSNIIIAQSFGPSEVTTYNIGFRYFAIITMAFSIIVSPFWAAFTEAWVKNEVFWIKKMVKKLLNIWLLLIVVGIIMLIFSNNFYYLWIGDKVQIPFQLSLALLIYVITLTFGNIFTMFINGIGKVKLQVYSSIIGALLFVLLAVILIKYFKIGIIGIVIASTLCNIYGLILAPIQYYKLVNKKAHGIWAK